MKTAETKTASSPHLHQSGEPFFQKNGEGAFFSDRQTHVQTKPFFSKQAAIPFIQPKLTIGRPGDKYEQEADAMADQVVQRLGNPETDLQTKPATSLANGITPLVQPKCAACEEDQIQKKEEDEDHLEKKVQLKPIFESDEPPPEEKIQRKCACGNHKIAGGECAECSKKKRLGLQTKLKINEPGDVYEREADRVADQVMAMPAHPGFSGAPPRIQRFSGQPTGQMDAAPASVNEALASPGSPLEPSLRQDMEQRFGHDFSRVRVHSGATAEQSARDIDANAYTVGRDVVFGAGQYAPASRAGKKLIAHELAHVVQQRDVPNNLQKLSLATEVTGEHEREADMAAKVVGLGYSARVMGRVNSSRVQRKPRGAKIDLGKAAGGCGLCYGKFNIKNAGFDAHQQIKQDFEVMYPSLLPEFPIKLPQATHIISKGVPDLVLPTRTGFMIGEIKPANAEGYMEGEAKLVIYDRLLNLRYKKINPNLTVERMDQKPPPPSTFVEPAAGICKQAIIVNPSVRGVYGYLCYPPWSYQLSKRCCRGRGKEKEDKKKKDKKKPKKPKGTRTPRVRSRLGSALRGGGGLLNLLSLFEAFSTIQDAKAHLDAMFGPYQALWDEYEKQLAVRNQGKNTATTAQPTPPLPQPRPEPEPPQKPPEKETTVRLFEITRSSRLSEREASIPSASIETSYFPVEFFSLTRPGESTFSVDASQIDCSRIHKGIVGVSGYQRYTGYAQARNVNELNKLLGLQIGFAQLGCAMSRRGPQPAAQPDGDEISVTLSTSGQSVMATCKKLAGASESTCTSEGNFASMKVLMDDPELEVPPDFVLEVAVVRTRDGESQRSDRTISVWVENPDLPAPEPSMQADGSVPTDASDWKAYPSGSEIAYLLELYSRWGP